MSRYNVDGYNYGFDGPLSQFFLSKGKKHIVGPMAAKYGNNYTMLEALKKEGILEKIPMEHRKAIESDFAF